MQLDRQTKRLLDEFKYTNRSIAFPHQACNNSAQLLEAIELGSDSSKRADAVPRHVFDVMNSIQWSQNHVLFVQDLTA